MEASAILSKNSDLKNQHIGNRCFVIGNGPSLNYHNFSMLKNEIKICVNSFHNHTDFKTIPPNYWVLADPVYWKRRDEFLVPILQTIEANQILTKLFLPINGKINLNNHNFINMFYYQFGKKGKFWIKVLILVNRYHLTVKM